MAAAHSPLIYRSQDSSVVGAVTCSADGCSGGDGDARRARIRAAPMQGRCFRGRACFFRVRSRGQSRSPRNSERCIFRRRPARRATGRRSGVSLTGGHPPSPSAGLDVELVQFAGNVYLLDIRSRGFRELVGERRRQRSRHTAAPGTVELRRRPGVAETGVALGKESHERDPGACQVAAVRQQPLSAMSGSAAHWNTESMRSSPRVSSRKPDKSGAPAASRSTPKEPGAAGTATFMR